MVLPCKNKEEGGGGGGGGGGGRRGLRPWPLRCLSQFPLRENKENLDRLVLASVCVPVKVRMRIGVPFTVRVSMYL